MASAGREELLARLRALEPQLKARYKAQGIALFGSIVRGGQGQATDVNLLVEFQEEADLFDLVGLALFLEEELGRKVDVTPRRALKAELRDAVLREAVPL
jgi:predicted nucleotidyltransferase